MWEVEEIVVEIGRRRRRTTSTSGQRRDGWDWRVPWFWNGWMDSIILVGWGRNGWGGGGVLGLADSDRAAREYAIEGARAVVGRRA